MTNELFAQIPAEVIASTAEFDNPVDVTMFDDPALLPPVEMYEQDLVQDGEQGRDDVASPKPSRAPLTFRETAMVELPLADFYLAFMTSLKPGMSKGQKMGAIYQALSNHFAKHFVIVVDQLVVHMQRLNEAKDAIAAEKARCKRLEAANEEYELNTTLIARQEKIIEVCNEYTRDILSTFVAFKTMPASKALKSRGHDVRFDVLADLRKDILSVTREEAYHQARNDQRLLHPGIVKGWIDSPMSDISGENGYIQQMKLWMESAREVKPSSKLDQAEESIYTNELQILSPETEYLLKTFIEESGVVPNPDDFTNGKARVKTETRKVSTLKDGCTLEGYSIFEIIEGKVNVDHLMNMSVATKTTSTREVSDEETQVALIRAQIAILKDDRNFLTLSGKPRGRQHHFDRIRVAEAVQEELDRFCYGDVRKHAYRVGDGKGRSSIQVPKIDDLLTPTEAAYRRDYTDTLWVVEVRRSANSKDWTVVSYGRDRILSEPRFAEMKVTEAQELHGKEARVHFERW